MSKMSLGSLDVIYITMESVIGIRAVVGNVLVIWAVRLNPALQKTTFFYIVSLALTDIAMGILVVPLAVMVSLGVVIHFYSCLFMCCLMMVFSHASILSLLAVAVDRYLRVKLPISIIGLAGDRQFSERNSHEGRGSRSVQGSHHEEKDLCDSGTQLACVCAGGAGPYAGVEPAHGQLQLHRVSLPGCDANGLCGVFQLLCLDPPTLLIMYALYTKIFYIMWIKLSQNSASLPGGEKVCGKEYKMAKYLALILFLFAVSWLPLGILNCVMFFCPSCAIPQPLMYLGILLSHANSAMNPVIYAFKIQKFKETYTFILRTYILLQKSESVISSVEHTVELGESTM
ncbi:unnamed protein product [Bubo scandiacus]